MRPGYDQSPLNPLPPVLWLLALPLIAAEAAFGLGALGFLSGGTGTGGALRQIWVERLAFSPQLLGEAWARGDLLGVGGYRLLSYPLVHFSLTHAVFVVVFLLALGNMIAQVFRPWSIAVLFVASAVGAALAYAGVAQLVPGWRFEPLVGGYPAVYGLLGAFTFLLWTRLAAENANRLRAFTLIGMLLAFQLVFGIVFGNAGLSWVAEVAGFAIGFALSFLLVPGGLARVRQQIRHR